MRQWLSIVIPIMKNMKTPFTPLICQVLSEPTDLARKAEGEWSSNGIESLP